MLRVSTMKKFKPSSKNVLTDPYKAVIPLWIILAFYILYFSLQP